MKQLNLKHQTHFETIIKFCLLLGVFVSYFAYLSFKYDLVTGGVVSSITWSFFVLCTPIADAGFILDLPVRLLFKIKMIYTELFVWLVAILLNLSVVLINPSIYKTTHLTSFFYKILTNPYPYWGLILMCSIGTFLSVSFGDEMLNVFTHKNREHYHKNNFRYKIISMISIFIMIIIAYKHIIIKIGREL